MLDSGGTLTITPPSWRPDLNDPYDYVEEVGRLIGFDTIEPVVPTAPVGRGLTRSQRARRAINLALAARGFVEVLSFPFASTTDLDLMGVPADDQRRRLNKIVNPLSEASPYLRTSHAARAVRGSRPKSQSRQRRPGPLRGGLGVLRQ